MAVKRKYQGPPYVLGRSELAARRAMTVGMLRQLGLMALQHADAMPPKGLNPLPFLELHNLRATERWLLVHLPDADPAEVSVPPRFVTLDLVGQHTDRYDWSIVSELGRVSKPRDKGEPGSMAGEAAGKEQATVGEPLPKTGSAQNSVQTSGCAKPEAITQPPDEERRDEPNEDRSGKMEVDGDVRGQKAGTEGHSGEIHGNGDPNGKTQGKVDQNADSQGKVDQNGVTQGEEDQNGGARGDPSGLASNDGSPGGDAKTGADQNALNTPLAQAQPSHSTESPESPSSASPQCSLQSLCSSSDELAAQGYPSTGVPLDAHPGTGEGFAIDCEMSLAGQTQVLTRIAVVRFSDGAQLLDQLVKPAQPITDYVTQYSGITAEMLAGVEFGLRDVHAWMRQHIGASDVLIGHSLNNDLAVLDVSHPHIVDTALLFPHYLGPSYHSSLRYLARKFLGVEIQTAASGHNPVEDAVTCERLVRWLMHHGRAYSRIDPQTTSPLSALLAADGARSTIIGPDAPVWDADGTAAHLVEKDLARATQLAARALDTHQFVCATLRGDAAALSQQLDLLVQRAPARTLVTVCFAPNAGLSAEIQRLRRRKTAYAKEFRTQRWDAISDPWTSEDDTLLKNTIKRFGAGAVAMQITLDPAGADEWPEAVKRRFRETPNKPSAAAGTSDNKTSGPPSD